MKKNNLYIKIGNTTTTFCIFENYDENKINKKTIYTKDLDKEQIESIISSLNFLVRKIFISSVVKGKNEIIENYFVDNEKVFLGNNNQEIIDIKNIQSNIGSDILATAIACVNAKFSKTLILSLGTFSTITYLEKNKIMGCVILPGIKKTFDSYPETFGVSFHDILNESELPQYGVNNVQSLSLGTLLPISLIINHYVKMNNIKNIIYTGGHAMYFNNKHWKKVVNLELIGLLYFSFEYERKEK